MEFDGIMPKKGYKQTVEHIKNNKKFGEKHGLWKGDKVGHSGLHDWIRRRKPKPLLCEKCGKTKPYDLANISGLYKRDTSDFRWLCRHCHMTEDGRIKILINRITSDSHQLILRKANKKPWTEKRKHNHRLLCKSEEHRKSISLAWTDERKKNLKLVWIDKRKRIFKKN